MIYIFTALYKEAAGIIQYYGLKRQDVDKRIQIFAKDDVVLTVTGVGAVNAATVVSYVLTRYGATDTDFLVNLGTCAARTSLEREIFLCNKITDDVTGKTFYPDVLWKHDFKEISVTTVSNVLEQKDIAESVSQETVFDMEASAIYQAGSFFMGPHQMNFVKVVSDAGVDEGTSTTLDIEKMLKLHLREIVNYLEELKCISKDLLEKKEQIQDTREGKERFNKLTADMKCSVTMENELKQYYEYSRLAGIDFWEKVECYYREEILPCKSKREGKDILNELTGKLL